jgi:hypothetical protein
MRPIIKKIEAVLEEVEQERGPLLFAALVEREDTPGRYDLLLSAEWARKEREFYQMIVSELVNHFTDADWSLYSRTVFLDPDGEFIHDFSEAVGQLNQPRDLRNTRIVNTNILYAHLFPTHPGRLPVSL